MWLKNEIVEFRALEPEDLALLHQWENEPRNWASASTLQPYSQYDIKQYIAHQNYDLYKADSLKFMLQTPSGEAVGMFDIYHIDHFNGRAEVGVFIDHPYRGKGYATQAYVLAQEYAFQLLGWQQLYSYVPQNNTASQRTLLAAGFVQSGKLQNWYKTPTGFEDALIFQVLSNPNKQQQ